MQKKLTDCVTPVHSLVLLCLLSPLLSANADTFGQQDSVSYSPDRWPSRWSSVAETSPTPRPRTASRVDGSYYVDSYEQVPQRYTRNRDRHSRDHLFDVPTESRPWGELPRSSRRYERRYDRQTRPCREQRPPGAYFAATSPGFAAGAYSYPYSAYPYMGGAYGLPGLAYPYAGSAIFGTTLGYPGVVPGAGVYPGYPGFMGYPGFSGYPGYGVPYGGYPSGLTGMNWPFGAW